MFIKRSLSLLGLFQLVACSTSGTVVVRTQPPEAQVYYFNSKTGENSVIGKTPLTFSKTLNGQVDSEVLQLRIEKEGYESKYTSIATFGGDTTYVDVKLSSALAADANVRRAFELNRKLMIEATRLAAQKRYSEALARTEKVLSNDPKNDEAHAAKGSLLYLMKDYDGASMAWRKALEINPSNDDVRASLVDLNLNLDSTNRSPASTTEGQ